MVWRWNDALRIEEKIIPVPLLQRLDHVCCVQMELFCCLIWIGPTFVVKCGYVVHSAGCQPILTTHQHCLLALVHSAELGYTTRLHSLWVFSDRSIILSSFHSRVSYKEKPSLDVFSGSSIFPAGLLESVGCIYFISTCFSKISPT